MRRSLHILFIFSFLFIGNRFSYGTGSDAGSYKIIKLISRELGIDRNTLKLQNIESECLTSAYIQKVFRVKKDGEESGFAIAAQGKGRHDKFYYLIYFTEDKEVDWIRVTGYFSNHGGQITSKRWLQQFKGFAGGILNYGKDVQAISGATISGNSITDGIKEITTQMQNCDL